MDTPRNSGGQGATTTTSAPSLEDLIRTSISPAPALSRGYQREEVSMTCRPQDTAASCQALKHLRLDRIPAPKAALPPRMIRTASHMPAAYLSSPSESCPAGSEASESWPASPSVSDNWP